MNWRNLSVLLVLSSALACAKASNDDLPAGDLGGADNGGSDPIIGGGAPAGGSNGAGAPGAGAPSAGAQSGGASGGAVSHGGAAGAPSGGHSGTSSGGVAGALGGASGAAGVSGSAGSGGDTSTGPCANPKDVTGGNSMNFGTLDGVCLRTKDPFNTIGCSNFDGRTIKVNGTLAPCTGMKATFAPAIDGWNYFDVSAGTLVYASFNWYSS